MPPPTSPLAGAAIVFDLDGTLVDTAPDLVAALNGVLVQEGLAPLPLEVARPMIGRGARVLIARGFEAAGRPLTVQEANALYPTYIDRYRTRLARETRPFRGAPEALAALVSAGARMAVCTNKPTALAVALLAELGLAERFVAVVGPEFVSAPKPDPSHLLATLERLGARRPADALMVGDSAADAHAARAAGVPLALVTFGYTEEPAAAFAPDLIIDAWAEAPEAIAAVLVAHRRAR